MPRAGEPRPHIPAATFASDALCPSRVLIHPLSRAAVLPDGGAVLIIHTELLDRFNQNTHALGRLRLTVLPPTSIGIGDHAAEQPPDSTWIIDLADPEANARLYDDLVTRTYIFRLTDLPNWLSEWVASSDTDSPILNAEFEFTGLDGVPHTISTTTRLAR